jgi:hypothetical protein
MQKESLKSQIVSPTTLQSTPLKLPDVKFVIELKLVSRAVLKELTPALTELVLVAQSSTIVFRKDMDPLTESILFCRTMFHL